MNWKISLFLTASLCLSACESGPSASAGQTGEVRIPTRKGALTTVPGEDQDTPLVKKAMGFSQFAARVLPDVQTMVQQRGTASVVVLLDVAEQESVQAVTDRVLDGLLDADFQLSRRYQVVPAMAGTVSRQGLERLRNLPRVLAIQPEQVMSIDVLPSTVVQSTQAHTQLGVYGQGVRVAVVDTGVDAKHPDFAGRIVAQQCFSQAGCPGGKAQGSDAKDQNGHGSHVASLILGGGKVAPQGMAPKAELVAIRVLDKDGSGTTSDIIAGLDWAAVNAKSLKIRALNLSLGGQQAYSSTCDKADPTTAKAIALLNKAGVAVFAAAGNGGVIGGLSSPACLSQVTSVGATYVGSYGAQTFPGLCSDAKTAQDMVTCFSNRSKDLDLLAPGAYLTGAAPGGGTAVMAGTSQATPIAVGVATLLLGCKPTITAAQLLTTLQKTGKAVIDAGTGLTFYRVNALAAAQLACK